jgi:GDPmannose 4,6-dehydratase
MRSALIIGANGQDGRLLYDFLLKKRYVVIGIDKNCIRCSQKMSYKKIDILKFDQVVRLIKEFKPQEVYYLAAFHHSSEDLPIEDVALLQQSYQVHVAGFANFLEAIKLFSSKTKIFYAASSHIFGETTKLIQTETMPINPHCIYGITKASGLALSRFYRSRYGIFAAAGILYNHESSLRAQHFVSKKIIDGAINIKAGKQKKIVLGDLDAVVDWGYAPDYVRAMHLILKAKAPDDFIVATGKKHTVLDFVKVAFGHLKLNWKDNIEIDRSIVRKKSFSRIGNPAKLRTITGWKPKVSFKEMIKKMVTIDSNVFQFKAKDTVKRRI